MFGRPNKNQSSGAAIGVFDSGLGGLTVFKHLLNQLPEYNYIYLGDTARVPYGEKSADTIYEYSREAMDFLFSRGCQLIIVACNTASAQALRRLQQEYLPAHHPEKRILGVIRPLAEKFTNSGYHRIGVIGTKATISSEAYLKEIKNLDPQVFIEQNSAPLLVPLIENGWAKKPETKIILKKYLRPLKAKQIDALILGCTHYSFLIEDIRRIMGKRVNVPDPGEIIANSLATYLKRHPELNLKPTKSRSPLYYTTDTPASFRLLGEKFLDKQIDNIEQVDICGLIN